MKSEPESYEPENFELLQIDEEYDLGLREMDNGTEALVYLETSTDTRATAEEIAEEAYDQLLDVNFDVDLVHSVVEAESDTVVEEDETGFKRKTSSYYREAVSYSMDELESMVD